MVNTLNTRLSLVNSLNTCQHTEKEVFSSKRIADKLQRELEHTLKQINFRTSADEILGLFSNVTLSLEDFAFRLNDLVKV